MERATRDNTAVCLIDHQIGLLTGVRDITTDELTHNVVGLARAAQVLDIPIIIATTAKDELWGPTLPQLVEAVPKPAATIDRMTVNAWDEPQFVAAVEATGRTHLIFAGITTQICAAFPAYSAIAAGYTAYVVVDASGAMSPTQREAGIARMAQQGVILADYFTMMAEIMASNDDPKADQVYTALDLGFSTLVQGIVSWKVKPR